jgi:geranylgeranyl diphosphate synthase, type II
VDAVALIERSLAGSLEMARGFGEAPLLVAAMRYAVFPGGARIRPRLCLAVSRACAAEPPPLCLGAATAIELMHCASLVHDDLPCFDDAATRRGKPSVHRAFDERIAVLAGDALIVLAFQSLLRAGVGSPSRLGRVMTVVAAAVGSPGGIIAGQAWECEPKVALASYQRAKTGALFAAAAAAGACAAGRGEEKWHELGERLGEAYQIADDIRDVAANPAELGKPTGRDEVLGRPNAVHALGMGGAIERLEGLVEAAVERIPDCPGAVDLRAHIRAEAARLLPRELARPAA